MIVKVAVISQDPVDVQVDAANTMEPVDVQVDAVTRIPAGDVPVYDGPYEAIPKVTAQTLQTAQKFMREDVSVRAIPYFDVSNPAGGNTIYIANEV